MNSVEVSVSHQVVINGQDAWVKLSVHKDATNEKDWGIEEAIEQANEIVQRKIIEVIENTAQTVMDWEKRNK